MYSVGKIMLVVFAIVILLIAFSVDSTIGMIFSTLALLIFVPIFIAKNKRK